MPNSIPNKMQALLRQYCLALLAGLFLPLGFAPFHWPVFIFLGLALFYQQILKKSVPFRIGFCFGIGFFGFGVSWVWTSIHEFGHLNYCVSFIITSLLVFYLSLYTAFTAYVLKWFVQRCPAMWSPLLFSTAWTIFELLRAHVMGGLPWLLIGFSQMDTPLAHLLPYVGVYGTGFIAVWAAALLPHILYTTGINRMKLQTGFIIMVLAPLLLPLPEWNITSKSPISVTVVQSNLAMRDKWNETLYWQILTHYKGRITQSLHSNLIVLPESAIPLPAEYVEDYVQDIDKRAKQAGSAIIFGIPQATNQNNTDVFYNTLQVIGRGMGSYQKQHLVPFGEYVPYLFSFLNQWAPLHSANLQAGSAHQPLPFAHKKPFAALICYELAFGEILRHQMPLGQWIVSISDDGWFGRSLAPYQQQQMAQVRSLQTARYQIMANNDGLSAIIDPQGRIVDSLPAFKSGLLHSSIVPLSLLTPWVKFGDWPIILLLMVLTALGLGRALKIHSLRERKHRQSKENRTMQF